jgi:tetratricopeptide (TPR) repeat protein
MYKPFRLGIIITCFLSIHACSFIPSKIWYQSTESLLDQGEFKKALEQIAAEGNESLYVKVRKQALNKSKHKVTTISSYIDNKQWGMAEKKLNQLSKSFPWQDTFVLLKYRIDQGEAEETRLLKTQLALAQVEILRVKHLTVEFDRRRLNINHSWYFTESRLNNEKLTLAQSLYRLSLLALNQQDYQNAQKAYSEALKLNPLLDKYGLAITISRKINQKNNNAIKTKQASLIIELDNAILSEDFTKIITLQDILSKAPFKGEKLDSILNQATASRQKRALTLDKQADTYYRTGELINAIELWAQAKTLAPDDLNYHNKLARASRVQSKLTELRSQN